MLKCGHLLKLEVKNWNERFGSKNKTSEDCGIALKYAGGIFCRLPRDFLKVWTYGCKMHNKKANKGWDNLHMLILQNRKV